MLLNPLVATIALLAQDAAAGGAGAGAANGGPAAFFTTMMPLFLILTLYYVMFVLPQKSKDKRYSDLLSSLKENDHVVTTGGIYGVITSVQRDTERVTIRLDENSGAKMKIATWAIAEVLGDDKGKATGSKSANDKK